MTWHRVFFDIELAGKSSSTSTICHISMNDSAAILAAKQMMPYLIDGEKWAVKERIPLTPEQEQELYNLHPQARQYK